MSLFDQIKPDRPMLMGILNITPDSFSDGGVLYRDGKPNIDSVMRSAESMLQAGADILDVGGESTRPSAVRPSVQEELDRVAPVVEVLSERLGCNISVDTSSVEVMRQVVASGAKLINDVRALSEPGAMEFLSASSASLCLMHMQGQPDSMQDNPKYLDPVSEVYEFLQARVQTCLDAGITRDKISIDPGFGFGKSHQHNMALMAKLPHFAEMGFPLLVGVSRKGMIGELTQKPLQSRLAGSIAMAQVALDRGANILRVHDVAETCDMIRVWTAIKRLKEGKLEE